MGNFVEQPEGYYRVRMRSKGPVINEIAKRHHGGGHPLASGANAADLEEVAAIYQEIQTAVSAFSRTSIDFIRRDQCSFCRRKTNSEES